MDIKGTSCIAVADGGTVTLNSVAEGRGVRVDLHKPGVYLVVVRDDWSVKYDRVGEPPAPRPNRLAWPRIPDEPPSKPPEPAP